MTKQPARAYGGADQLASIAAGAVIAEPAVCPDCSVISRLLHLSLEESIQAIAHGVIPCMSTGDNLRKAKCVLCAAAASPSVRAQEAATGHIWFLIGDHLDTIPPQSALNQHFWSAIANTTPRTRAAARNRLLEFAASEAFGRLQLPHLVISPEERTWLLGCMQRSLGDDASSILGEEAIQAFIDQWGVTLLVQDRKPKWAPHVRFIPTPRGIEAYRLLMVLPESAPPEQPPHRRNR